MMKRRARLVLFTNSSYALAMAQFFLPIKKIMFRSQRATVGWKVVQEFSTFEVGTKTTAIVKACPPKKLCTIKEVLYGMPPGHDPKIDQMDCVYSTQNESGKKGLYNLRFAKVTLHKSFSTEEDFLSQITSMLWKMRQDIEKEASVQIPGWKPSFLVLNSINNNPTFSNTDFLFRLESILCACSKILRELCATVWEVRTTTGVLEYEPILHS